ncbi:DUF4258 domain-containing protein [Chlorobium sp. KB01]|uniref:DUF4258 domain-containing protein n=1 Tax=Chlorobium sp. KB01 TaxID=1917528 RepID=UPI0018E96631|nr:DUF4258 domain-containing protein [Chlorobium sp. KB01]
MLLKKEIEEAIRLEMFRITDHAYEEALSDNLTFKEIIESVFQGEIIEQYPTDKPYPSCLIFGENSQHEPIHSVWACNRVNSWAVIITVYRPNPKRWIDWKTRRKSNDPV